MKKFAIICFVLLSACTRATPEQQIINDAAAALGGRDRVLAIKTLIIDGEGTNGNLGQDMTPEATSQTFTVTGYERAVDVMNGRVRIEQTRTPNFIYFQGQQPQKQVQGLDGEVAYNVSPSGDATRAANTVAKDRRAEFYHHPITIVRAALDPSAKLSNIQNFDKQRIIDVTIPAGTFTLAIDGTTSLPTRVVSMTDNTNLGDVAIETSFENYQDVSGLKVPTMLTTKTDRFTTATLRVTNQRVDASAGDLAAPGKAAAAPIAAPPPATVSVEPLAKGIWFLAGQSHHSVLIDFGSHLTLIEAPQNDTRALAVIAKARELVPGKPLTQVINTHHHFDHSGGIRAAVSEDLAVITHKANLAFYQDAIRRAHTILPDALQKNPKPLKIETVDGQKTLQEGGMTVELYPIEGSAHADTLLMAYFPRERLLVEADVFSPGGAVAPYAANLLENIRKRNLRVDRIVPIHGKVVPFSELTKTVAAVPTN